MAFKQRCCRGATGAYKCSGLEPKTWCLHVKRLLGQTSAIASAQKSRRQLDVFEDASTQLLGHIPFCTHFKTLNPEVHCHFDIRAPRVHTSLAGYIHVCSMTNLISLVLAGKYVILPSFYKPLNV